MSKIDKYILSTIVSFGFLVACLQQTVWSQEDKRIKVLASTYHIADLAQIIGGEHVLVSTLIDSDVNPHTFKPSERDVSKLVEADIVFYNGLSLETHMSPIFKRLKQTQTAVAIGQSIPKELRLKTMDAGGGDDPHIWFDVTLWMKAVDTIAQTLAEADPSHSEHFLLKADNYKKELSQLNEYVAKRAQGLSELKRVIVTADDAFGYFGRKYGFEVISPDTVNNDNEKLVDLIVKRKIQTVFGEATSSEKLYALQRAVRNRGWNVGIEYPLYADTLGKDKSFEGTYIGMMTHNIDAIVSSLAPFNLTEKVSNQ